MQIKQFEFNPLGENTYVLYDDSRECVVIDPGCFFPDEKAQLAEFIDGHDLTVKHLINTHLHFDHIFGSAFVEQTYDIRTEAHPADEFMLDGLAQRMQMFGFRGEVPPPTIGRYLHEGDSILFGSQTLDILEVPGHSPGSIAFYNAQQGCIFVGDALFRGSIGRTDLEGGNHQQLLDAIRTKLFTLPPETVVYSGHGPATTIGFEMQHNPFFA